MFKTTLKALIGSTAIVSAVVIFSADADAGKRRASGFSAPVKMKVMKTDTRRSAIKRQFTGTSGVPAQGASEPLGPGWMADICNAKGGGASTNPDGGSSCVDPDGNDIFEPTPPPKP